MPHLTLAIAGQDAKNESQNVHINIIISVSIMIFQFPLQIPLILSLECMAFVWVNTTRSSEFSVSPNATSAVHIRQPQQNPSLKYIHRCRPLTGSLCFHIFSTTKRSFPPEAQRTRRCSRGKEAERRVGNASNPGRCRTARCQEKKRYKPGNDANIWVLNQKYGKNLQIIPCLIGFSTINHPFWGFSPYFWKHPYCSNWKRRK